MGNQDVFLFFHEWWGMPDLCHPALQLLSTDPWSFRLDAEEMGRIFLLIFTYPLISNCSAGHKWKDGEFSSLLARTWGGKQDTFLPSLQTEQREGEKGCRYTQPHQARCDQHTLQHRGVEPKQLNKARLSACWMSSGPVPSWSGHPICGQLSTSSALACVSLVHPRHSSFMPLPSPLSPPGFHLHIYKTNWLSWFTTKINFTTN